MAKFKVQVSRLSGTCLQDSKLGEVVELSTDSLEVKSLVERGWITPIKESVKEEAPIEESETETEEAPKPKKKTNKK